MRRSSLIVLAGTALMVLACADGEPAATPADVEDVAGTDATSADGDSVAAGVDTPADGACQSVSPVLSYSLTDTLQDACYDQKGDAIACPAAGQPWSGQDAAYTGLQPSWALICGEAVVLDERTGLMWERAHHEERVVYAAAAAACEALDAGGFDDWRVPSIKELLSISDWRGSQHEVGAFYLDGDVFDFDYPDLSGGELTGSHNNQMMGQTWSSTSRPDADNVKADTKYFFNFLDAHIKSQSTQNPNGTLFYRCVRGDAGALDNDLTDNGDGTVTDAATGLVWQQANGKGSDGTLQFNWRRALDYCEGLELAGQGDWRLPDVKALQSIVDYTPADWSTRKMVLDPIFGFELPAGKDLDTPPTTSPPNGTAVAPFFWSSTTHGDNTSFAAYVCFGPCWAVEAMNHNHDVHGPGAQRADPKADQMGQIWDMIGGSIGDQKDVVQIDNFVRCVRGGSGS